VTSFFHGERITYAVLAVLVGLIAGGGALTLTDVRLRAGVPDPKPAQIFVTSSEGGMTGPSAVADG